MPKLHSFSEQEQLIIGLHAVQTALETHPERISRLLLTKERQDQKIKTLRDLAHQHHVSCDELTRKELDLLTNDLNHQGCAAYVKTHIYGEQDLGRLLTQTGKPPFILILDSIQDPHNLGACFRSADAAGVDFLVAPKDKAVGLTGVVSKVSSGATETVPFVQVTNLVRSMEQLKKLGVWLYGLDAEAKQSLYQTDLKGPAALILGAEGTGLRRLTKEHCDLLISIPMQGSVESLNVSVAAGICLFEAVRQRNIK